jgi:hypothetical protein
MSDHYTLPDGLGLDGNIAWQPPRRSIASPRDDAGRLRLRQGRGRRAPFASRIRRPATWPRARFEVTVDGATTTLPAGSSFIVAPNLVHGVVALEEGLLIDTFTPRRDDFL